jgi:hypothetical protein
MNDTVTIFHFLGLGDHIICNGLVRNLILPTKNYRLIVKNRNYKSVSFMYRDLYNLSFLIVDDEIDIINYIKNYKSDIIKMDFDKHLKFLSEGCCWDLAFYKEFGIDFKKRWDDFYIKRDLDVEYSLYKKLNPYDEPFVLIHNIDSLGVDRINYNFVTRDKLIIEVKKTETIFDYIHIIEKADEIHCIDSSFIHLVESVSTNTDKLYYHRNFNKRSESDHTTRKKWEII